MTPLDAFGGSFLGLRLDPLGALFLGVVLVVSLVAAVYAPPYLASARYAEDSRLRFALLYALFVAGMSWAVLASHLIAFLVAWEGMTLASYVLVTHETRDDEAPRAAFKYFVMTHCGTACLLLGAVWLGVRAGSFEYDALPGAMVTLAAERPLELHGILALMLVGFVTKAGLWPFGDWLPDAHPAAPAPVSAVLSGVMVKLGVYGVLRFFVGMLAVAAPAAAAAWGWPLLALGALSAVIGGAAACGAADAKQLLAYSSIAQSGLLTLGIGAALVLAPLHPALAALALLGAMFHLLSDAAIKSLLFLNAGAAQHATGTRRLEALGGLFQAMPVTGWTALVASLAIAGFPPFSGFTGKWMMLQATVLSGVPLVTVAGLLLLVASLLSVLYAAKFFVSVFALRAMRPGSLEVPRPMRAAEVALALAIVALSLAPGAGLDLARSALAGWPGIAAAGGGPALRGFVLDPASGAVAPVILVLLAGWVVVLVRLALGRSPAPLAREIWTGGSGPAATPPAPAGWFEPVRGTLARAYPRLAAPRLHAPAWIPHLVDSGRWVAPAAAAGRRVTSFLRHIHTGVPQVYLAWQLAGAAALALLLAWLVGR